MPKNECTYNPKVAGLLFVTKGKASNNFKKHLTNNDVDKIKAQIKRGSVIIKN